VVEVEVEQETQV
jgi:hypothetical protein